MTVADLIEKLKAMPQDLRVVVDGYESGLEDVTDVSEVVIELNRNSENWYGPHEAVASWRPTRGGAIVPAVHMS